MKVDDKIKVMENKINTKLNNVFSQIMVLKAEMDSLKQEVINGRTNAHNLPA